MKNKSAPVGFSDTAQTENHGEAGRRKTLVRAPE